MKIKISIIQPALAKDAIFWARRPPCNGFNLALLVFADDRKSYIKYQRVLVFVSADEQKSSQKYQRVSVNVSADDRKSSQKYQRMSVLISVEDRKISGTKFFRYRFRDFFTVLNFSDTGSETFFRYQIFPIPATVQLNFRSACNTILGVRATLF